MELILYAVAVLLVRALQALPLPWVAWIGRRLGAVAFWLDGRHRRVALQNLTLCFGSEKSPAEIRSIAHENFRRLGENYCSAIKTASMSWDQLQRYVQFTRIEKMEGRDAPQAHRYVVAIGHFGNFELYARFGSFLPGFECATTYRALKQPSLNRLLQNLRQQSGCLFFERRTDAAALKAALSERPLILGLLADQHAGQHGLRVPFFEHDCSTSPAPAVLALRYQCLLYTGICYRTGLGRWQIEAGDRIPTHEGKHPRSIQAISEDINRAFETAVRRDPANWFWVHKRWKPFDSKRAARLEAADRPSSTPASATEA